LSVNYLGRRFKEKGRAKVYISYDCCVNSDYHANKIARNLLPLARLCIVFLKSRIADKTKLIHDILKLFDKIVG